MKKQLLVPPALRPPKVPGKRGAPFGNHNAFKHGKCTRERRALYANIREYISRGRALIEALRRPSAGFSVTPDDAEVEPDKQREKGNEYGCRNANREPPYRNLNLSRIDMTVRRHVEFHGVRFDAIEK
jgi:hypothetical protein